MENIFELTNDELKEIAKDLSSKIEEGFQKEGMEILCLPTYVNPKDEIPDAKALALDWGGTNFRASIIEFKDGSARIVETQKRLLDKNGTKGYTRDMLFDAMADTIGKLTQLDNTVTEIGYCFSYPAECMTNGDATLIRWTKGIDIPEMIGKMVGHPLLEYLNNRKDIINTTFRGIKVINDTVACLLAGLSVPNKDTYIGLIVGTGTNMAALVPKNQIEKLNSKGEKSLPVNFESGNFNPPYLTMVDNFVDAMSNNKGSQRFEKAISGGYLGELFKTTFWNEKIKYNFDGKDLSDIIDNPTLHKPEHALAASAIYERSAKLVAASLAGLVQVLSSRKESLKEVFLVADGSVYWGNPLYNKLVSEKLKELVPEVNFEIAEIKDPNLVGSAIAALS